MQSLFTKQIYWPGSAHFPHISAAMWYKLLRTHLHAGMMVPNHFMGNRCHTVSRLLASGIMHGTAVFHWPSWYLQSLGTAATSTRTDILLGKPAKMNRSVLCSAYVVVANVIAGVENCSFIVAWGGVKGQISFRFGVPFCSNLLLFLVRYTLSATCLIICMAWYSTFASDVARSSFICSGVQTRL